MDYYLNKTCVQYVNKVGIITSTLAVASLAELGRHDHQVLQ